MPPTPERAEVGRTSDFALLDHLYPQLRRFAAVIADSDVDPDDLVQDALVATLRRHELSELESPAAYLKRAMVNAVASDRRRKGLWRSLLPRVVSAASPATTTPPTSASSTPSLRSTGRCCSWSTSNAYPRTWQRPSWDSHTAPCGSERAELAILDGDGVLVGGEVFWHRDGFAYRLTGSNTVGDTTSARGAETVAEQLQLVERETWTAAVNDANSPFSIQTSSVEIGFALLVLIGWSGTVLGFAVWKKRRITPVLVLIAVAAAAWFELTPSFWFVFVLLILSLAAYGLLRSTPRAE